VTNVHALNGHYFCLSDLPVRTVYFNPVDYKLIALAASYIWGPSIPKSSISGLPGFAGIEILASQVMKGTKGSGAKTRYFYYRLKPRQLFNDSTVRPLMNATLFLQSLPEGLADRSGRE
jgi:hypothetical protein